MHDQLEVHKVLQSEKDYTDELKTRSTARQTVLEMLGSSSSEGMDLTQLKTLAVTRDQLISAQLGQVQAAVEHIDSFFKEEEVTRHSFSADVAKLRARCQASTAALIATYGAETPVYEASSAVSAKPDESSLDVSLWRDSSFQAKCATLNKSLEAAWPSMCSALASLSSVSSAESESKQSISVAPPSFWSNNLEPMYKKFELFGDTIPQYTNFICTAVELKNNEQRGFLSILRCVQQLEHDVIPYLEHQVLDQLSERSAKMKTAYSSLHAELKQLSHLKSEVEQARAWKKRYHQALDKQDDIEEELRSAQKQLERMKRREESLEEKEAEIKSLKLSSLNYKSDIIRPLLQEGAQYKRRCPELAHGISEFQLLNSDDVLKVPVLYFETDFASEEDQSAITMHQSRHHLILARQKFSAVTAHLAHKNVRQNSDEGEATVSMPDRGDICVLKEIGFIFDSERGKRLQLEIRRTVRTLQSVRHPHVIRLLGVAFSSDQT